jgi:hypothetical protein
MEVVALSDLVPPAEEPVELALQVVDVGEAEILLVYFAEHITQVAKAGSVKLGILAGPLLLKSLNQISRAPGDELGGEYEVGRALEFFHPRDHSPQALLQVMASGKHNHSIA